MGAALRLACAALSLAGAMASLPGRAFAQGPQPVPAQEPLNGVATVAGSGASAHLPTLAELEAAGATIGEIRIRNEDIFDLTDPDEDYPLFRMANQLHVTTRPGVIRRALLFSTGDPVSVRLIDETERLLRGKRYLYAAHIRPVAYRDGVVDLEVLTRDTWSLDLSVSFSHSGGANSSNFTLREYNLFGTGVALSYLRNNSVDRSGNEFRFQSEQAFGGWTSLRYSVASNTDGRRQAASVLRPFYALDARWAAGASASSDDRIESVYTAGSIAAQYRHREDRADVFGGLSDGLVNGWTRRHVIGLGSAQHDYRLEPDRIAPQALPARRTLVGPYVRLEVIEDRFRSVTNRDQIGRTETFALGFSSTLQLGRALRSLGSSHDPWLFSATASQGFSPRPDHDLLASVSVAGQHDNGHVERLTLGAAARYYMPLNRHWLLFGSAAADALRRPEPAELLTLGGDSGLRGYPLRYQTGERRVLVTLEARAFTDWYAWRLFRFGGAVYYDLGRAWRGPYGNSVNPGWLGSIGAGLRIFSARSAFGNMLHADIAVPLNREPGIQSVQFLVRTRTSF